MGLHATVLRMLSQKRRNQYKVASLKFSYIKRLSDNIMNENAFRFFYLNLPLVLSKNLIRTFDF